LLTIRPEANFSRLDLISYLDQHNIGTRLLFAGNITKQPYMIGRKFRVSGVLENTDIAMNNTFWIGVQPALTNEMLDFVVSKIESFCGVTS